MPGARLPPKIQERYRRDFDFRLEVDYCVSQGIPFSFYLGGKNEWDEYSRLIVQVHEIERLTTCPDCHTKREEWDPKKGGDIHAYYPEGFICSGCAAKEELIHTESVNNHNKVPYGLKVGLVTKEERMKDIERRNEERANAKAGR